MNRILKSMLLVACMGMSFGAHTKEVGPFGMTMGMSKLQIDEALGGPDNILEPSKNVYLSLDAVVKSSYFQAYQYVVTPETGLCAVSAFSEGLSSDIAAYALYDEVKTALVSKYGQPSATNDFKSIDNEPIGVAVATDKTSVLDFWGVIVKGGKRVPMPMKGMVREIHLYLHAENSRTLKVNVRYLLKNYDSCKKHLMRAAAKGL